jgi:hypothetical protein
MERKALARKEKINMDSLMSEITETLVSIVLMPEMVGDMVEGKSFMPTGEEYYQAEDEEKMMAQEAQEEGEGEGIEDVDDDDENEEDEDDIEDDDEDDDEDEDEEEGIGEGFEEDEDEDDDVPDPK